MNNDFDDSVLRSFLENITSLASPQDAVSNTICHSIWTDQPTPAGGTFTTKWRVHTPKTIRKECRPRPPRQSEAGVVYPAGRVVYPSARGRGRGLQRIGEPRSPSAW